MSWNQAYCKAIEHAKSGQPCKLYREGGLWIVEPNKLK
jgi:hypothetical protein